MIAILGPTSSGKTAASLKLGKKFGLSIISADSRQIYKYFDIGTGKLPIKTDINIDRFEDKWVLNDIDIYGYDLMNPDEDASSHLFRKYYYSIKDKIINEDKIPMLVGGTGFYVETALTETEGVNVSPDYGLRSSLSGLPADKLIEMLPLEIVQKLNESEIKNKQRLIRKIEIYKALGLVPETKTTINESELIIFDAPNEYLFYRVDEWISEIWDSLIEEVNTLISSGLGNTIPMKGIVYKTVLDYIDGKTTEEAAFEETRFDLHSYIRRQKTWFKKYKNANIIDISKPNSYNEVENIVDKILNGK